MRSSTWIESSMSSSIFLDLASRGLRMPIGTDLILNESPDPEGCKLDGGPVGAGSGTILKLSRGSRAQGVSRQLAGLSTAPCVINGRKSLSLHRPSRIQNSVAKGVDEPQPCTDGAEHDRRNKQPLQTRPAPCRSRGLPEIHVDQNHEIRRADYCSGHDSNRDGRACEPHHSSGDNRRVELCGGAPGNRARCRPFAPGYTSRARRFDLSNDIAVLLQDYWCLSQLAARISVRQI